MNQTKKRTRCEVYSRIIGYLSPIDRWNAGKQAEWKKRRNFKLCERCGND